MAGKNNIEYSFAWKIENYSMCYRKHNEALKSPTFTPDHLGGSEWHLEYYPFGRKNKELKSCTLKRCDQDLCEEEISIGFMIEITNENGGVLAARGNSISRCNFKRGTILGWDDLATSDWKGETITIRLRMFGKSNLPTTNEAVTEVEIDKCCFDLDINLSDWVAAPVTRKYSVSKTSQYSISVTCQNKQGEIQICKLEGKKTANLVCGKIYLMNRLGALLYDDKHIFDLTDNYEVWNFSISISNNGCSTLFCEFSENSGNETSHIVNKTKNNNFDTFLGDLKSIFSNMKYSDIKLRSGNVILQAHKTFLSARSPVFSAMFDQEMLENQLGIVDITDVDAETLRTFLEFIYTGTVNLQDYKSVLKLLMTAEKYQVLSLKETCSEYLMQNISIENVGEILASADMLNMNQLKECALDYIAQNFTDITNSLGWSEFIESDAKLAAEILSYFATHFELKPKKN